MTIAFFVLAFVFIVVPLGAMTIVNKAPVGYQDATGFHFGVSADDQNQLTLWPTQTEKK